MDIMEFPNHTQLPPHSIKKTNHSKSLEQGINLNESYKPNKNPKYSISELLWQ